MNKQKEREMEALRRGVLYLDNRPILTEGDSPVANALHNQRDALAGVVERAMAQAAAQYTLASKATLVAHDEPTLRQDLLSHHIRPIVAVARGLKGTIPGIGVLVMVKTNGRRQTLITAATSFARKAEIYKSVLVEHGMPTDVIETLDSAIAAYRASIDTRGAARGDAEGATRAVEQEILLGRKILTMLNGVLTRALHDQPAELAAWRAASRVMKAAKSGRLTASASQPAASTGQPAASAVQPAA